MKAVPSPFDAFIRLRAGRDYRRAGACASSPVFLSWDYKFQLVATYTDFVELDPRFLACFNALLMHLT